MTDNLEAAINLTIKKMERNLNETQDVKVAFMEMAVDVMAQCAFGVTVDRSKDMGSPDEDILLKFGRESADTFTIPNAHYSRVQQLTFHLPWFERFYPFFGEAYDNLFSYFQAIKTQRMTSGNKRQDFMGRLVELCENLKTDPELKCMLTEDTIMAQASIFSLGGIETVAGCMAGFLYALMEHPGIQEDLYQEILAHIDECGGKLDSDAINALPYLDACLNESLRMYPPVSQHDRLCTKDCVVEGMPVKKGMSFHFPIYAAHMNPDFFEEPTVFKPERFFKGKKILF